jgi:hypothetical protein
MISNSDCPLGTWILQMFTCRLKFVHAGTKAFTCSKHPWCIIRAQNEIPNERDFLDSCCTVGKPKNSWIYFIPGYNLHMLSAEWSLVLLAVWRHDVFQSVTSCICPSTNGGDSRFLWIVGIYVPNYTVSHRTRQVSPKLPHENFEMSCGTACLK